MAQSKELKNLLRRVRRFNLSNPTNALNVEAIKRASSPAGIRAATTRLEKAQTLARVQRDIVKQANQVKELRNKGHVYEAATKTEFKPVKYKVPKTLAAAERELKRISNEREKAASFNRRQNAFVRKVAAYNRTLSLKENSKRYIYLPRNEKELAQHEKALRAVKKGDFDKAREILAIKGQKTKQLREVLMKRDARNAKKTGGFSYNDRLFLFQAITNSRSSPVPELADLFRAGGESLILELERAGFTMIEYYDPDMDMDDVGAYILEQLESTIDELNGRNQVIVRDFLSKVKGRY